MAKEKTEPTKRRGDVYLTDPIIKQIGNEEVQWIVANRYDGKKLKGPFKSEGEAYAAMKGYAKTD